MKKINLLSLFNLMVKITLFVAGRGRGRGRGRYLLLKWEVVQI